jgi:hypothetical protein
MEKIVITVTPEGYKVNAEGFTGGKCLVEQDALEKYLNQHAGIATKGKTQKKKLEQMYSHAPGEKVQY